MTAEERQAVLNIVAQVMNDNGHNRITNALVVGMCSQIDNAMLQMPPPVPPQQPEGEQP